MGCATAKGEFLGENAIFFINQNKEKICLATQINDFVLTGDIFNYSALPAANTPIHSAICEVTRRNHSRIIHYCKCQYCRPHSPCSTIEKEGLIYPEKVHSLLEYIFSEFKKQLPSKNPTQIAEYLVGKPYSKYDCSKTTQTIYPFLPRTAQEQYNYFEKRAAIIPLRYDLKEGDLIFFKDNTDAIKHVGYIVTNKNGNIEFIDSTFKKGVKPAYMNTDGREGSKNMYGEWHFAGGGRP
ncbi:MAG: hypothetical protein CVU77_06335 [Elusimicrobia bacterium HGW-Elusimicrobia-1]|nr:MAG: hypothetical protein CVU77_06335 [Elusimicrobia bacterium HGW-Elusimicrobia-1]